MNVTLSGVAFRDGTPYRTTLNLEKKDDGAWHAKEFEDAAKKTAQSGDTDQTETVRKKLSNQEIAELASKYDPRHMTREQYDSFLDDLIEKGALSRFDAMRLGHHGWRILDMDPEAFAGGGAECGTAYVTGSEDYSGVPMQTLEEANGDVLRWLEHMLARLSLGLDPSTREGSRQKEEAVNVVRDIIRQM